MRPDLDTIHTAKKPTYYFDERGDSVTYQYHAQWIAWESFKITDSSGDEWWAYPMLDFRDLGTHNEVWLIIQYYEKKPLTFEMFISRKKGQE